MCSYEVIEPFGFRVGEVNEDDGTYALQVEGTSTALSAAATHFESDVESLDPPEDGERYRMLLQFSAPDEDDPRTRMAVPPHDDNWAAWSVVGPLAEAIAELLDGTEVTADPPPWLQKELAMEEVSAPERMPFLALRASSVFPGMVKVVTFGRATSIATIERLLVTGQVRVALVLQHNPASEDPPAQVDDVEPIAVDARIVKAVRQEGQVLLVLKGIARLHVRDLDSKAELPAVTVAPSEPKPIVRAGPRGAQKIRAIRPARRRKRPARPCLRKSTYSISDLLPILWLRQVTIAIWPHGHFSQSTLCSGQALSRRHLASDRGIRCRLRVGPHANRALSDSPWRTRHKSPVLHVFSEYALKTGSSHHHKERFVTAIVWGATRPTRPPSPSGDAESG